MVKVTTERLADIAGELIDTIIRKNADYGNSWQSYGDISALTRVKDKLVRLETLSDGRRALVVDESVENTVTDIAGYCLLLMLWYRHNEQDSRD